MPELKRITLTQDDHFIAEWTTSQPVTFEQAWQVSRDIAAVLGYETKERSHKEAAFVQAFIGTCYYCGGSTGPDGKDNQVCSECGRIQ